MRIDPRTPKNLVDQAQAELNAARQREATAETQMERGDKLRANAWINQSELEALELEVANTRAAAVAARVALENARIGLDDTDVRAPSAGTILTRLVERGQVISSPTRDVGGGTVILTMADLTRVRARVRVDETDIGKLAAGMPARIQVAAFPGREFGGAVEKIEPQAVVDQNVTMFAGADQRRERGGPAEARHERGCGLRRRRARGRADAARHGAARGARHRCDRGNPRRSMPRSCARRVGAPAAMQRRRGARAAQASGGALALGRGLWVVAVQDGRKMPTPVETGITDLDRVEITGGLAEGDQVLLLPTASLVEIQQQIQDVASRRSGIPGLTQKPRAPQGAPPAAPAPER